MCLFAALVLCLKHVRKLFEDDPSSLEDTIPAEGGGTLSPVDGGVSLYHGEDQGLHSKMKDLGSMATTSNMLVSESFVTLHFDDKCVRMRTDCHRIDASEILALSPLLKHDQKRLVNHISRRIATDGPYSNQHGVWITCEDSKLLSNYLGLSHVLQPLFDHADEHQSNPTALPTESLAAYLQIFEEVPIGCYNVSIRKRDLWVMFSVSTVALLSKDLISSFCRGF